MRGLTKIIVHHSASAFGDAKWIRMTQIDPKRPGGPLPDLAYHYVICNGWRTGAEYDPALDGLVELGLPLERVGYHDKGENTGSIGACLIGHDLFTWAQLAGLHRLVSGLRAGTQNPLGVRGHLEDEPPATPTACPGARLGQKLDELRAFLAAPTPELGALEHAEFLRAVIVPGVSAPPARATAPAAGRAPLFGR